VSLGGAACFSIAGRKFSIVTERASFGMPESSIGFFNDSGASYFLSRLRNNVGMYMGLTGIRLHGYDLKKIGLCAYFVESKRLDELEKALTACTTEEEISKTIAKFSSVPSTETELDNILNEIDKTFDGDTCEEIVENLHLDSSDWAMDTVRILNRASPTSLKVCHRLLNLGKNLTLEECLKMEFRLAIHHVLKSDLKEGIRAFLIDKDNRPFWNPKTLHEVNDQHVERFFQPLPDGDELIFQTR
jgi:3-hydroxyisobutyryl-CoA hydrolase